MTWTSFRRNGPLCGEPLGQWCEALITNFLLFLRICWTNGDVAGDLRCHDITVMHVESVVGQERSY